MRMSESERVRKQATRGWLCDERCSRRLFVTAARNGERGQTAGDGLNGAEKKERRQASRLSHNSWRSHVNQGGLLGAVEG